MLRNGINRLASYKKLQEKLELVSNRLASPMTLSEKILYSHLENVDKQNIVQGGSYIKPRTGLIRRVQRYSTSAKHKIMCKTPDNKYTAKIYTLPNVLTFSRVAMSPAIGYFIWSDMYNQALVCFAFAAATDFLDGFLARRLNQESEFGAALDPVADKLLITTCLVSLYNVDQIPLMLVKGIISRDVFILSGAGLMRWMGLGEKASLVRFFDFKNYPSIGFEPTLLSKFNTIFICLVVMAHLGKEHLIEIVPNFHISLTVLHILTAGTTTGSAAQYGGRFISSEFNTEEKKFKG